MEQCPFTDGTTALKTAQNTLQCKTTVNLQYSLYPLPQVP